MSNKDQIVDAGDRADSERETADEAGESADPDLDPIEDDLSDRDPDLGSRPGRPASEDDDQTAVISLAALGSRPVERDWAFGGLEAESVSLGPDQGAVSDPFVSFINLGLTTCD